MSSQVVQQIEFVLLIQKPKSWNLKTALFCRKECVQVSTSRVHQTCPILNQQRRKIFLRKHSIILQVTLVIYEILGKIDFCIAASSVQIYIPVAVTFLSVIV